MLLMSTFGWLHHPFSLLPSIFQFFMWSHITFTIKQSLPSYLKAEAGFGFNLRSVSLLPPPAVFTTVSEGSPKKPSCSAPDVHPQRTGLESSAPGTAPRTLAAQQAQKWATPGGTLCLSSLVFWLCPLETLKQHLSEETEQKQERQRSLSLLMQMQLALWPRPGGEAVGLLVKRK